MRKQLNKEGYFQVDPYLEGMSLRKQLKPLMRDANKSRQDQRGTVTAAASSRRMRDDRPVDVENATRGCSTISVLILILILAAIIYFGWINPDAPP